MKTTTMTMICISGLMSMTLAQGVDESNLGVDENNQEASQIVQEAQNRAEELAEISSNDIYEDASSAVQASLKSMGLKPRYNPKNRTFIQIGSAEMKISDPHNNKDFIAIREVLAIEAYLSGKAKIIRSINQNFSAIEKVSLNCDYGDDPTSNKIEQLTNKLLKKKEELRRKLAELAVAESEQLEGASVSDRLGGILDGIAKKLDETYNSKDILEEKKQNFLAVKKECELLQKEFDEVQKLIDENPKPSRKISSDIESIAQMPLLGATVLTQSEKWDPTTKMYSVAMAVIWNSKLQEHALSFSKGNPLNNKKKGGISISIDDWIEDMDFSSMVGPRTFTDPTGRTIFVGIAAVDLTGKVKDRDAKKGLAGLSAEALLAFSLHSDVYSYREGKKMLREYDDDKSSSCRKFAQALMQQCKLDSMRGSMELHSDIVKHPISGRETYVVAYYLDPDLSKDALKTIVKAQRAAMDVITTSQVAGGVIAGGQKALDDQKKSKKFYDAGMKKGEDIVNAPPKKGGKKASPKGTPKSKIDENKNGSTGGTFTGDGGKLYFNLD